MPGQVLIQVPSQMLSRVLSRVQNFILTLYNVNQAAAPTVSSREKSKPDSKTQVPLRRGKKKISNRFRCFHRLYRHSVLFAVISILVAFSVSLPTHSVTKAPTSLALESPQTKSSHERGLNPVDMKIDSPTQSNAEESKGSTSKYAPLCVTHQQESP